MIFSLFKRLITKTDRDNHKYNSLAESNFHGHAASRGSPVLDKYAEWERGEKRNHAGHTFDSDTLRRIEEILPPRMERTAETGCGKSTILFSNVSSCHTVFALDDRKLKENSSILFYEECPLTKHEVLQSILGPTQESLLSFKHDGSYDAVLIDGPHGWPFPEFEYLMFYPHIKHGGYLIVDDVNIPTIGRMADILSEDEMWDLIEIVRTTVVFRRTDVQMFDPKGDGWWLQKYNRRRVSSKRDIFINEGPTKDLVTYLRLDNHIHGD